MVSWPQPDFSCGFRLGFSWKTLPLVQCQGWVFWEAAGLLTSVSSNSFCLKFSLSPRGKWANRKSRKRGGKYATRRFWASFQLVGITLSGLKKLARHLQTFCCPEKFAGLRKTRFRKPFCFSWRRNLMIKDSASPYENSISSQPVKCWSKTYYISGLMWLVGMFREMFSSLYIKILQGYSYLWILGQGRKTKHIKIS